MKSIILYDGDCFLCNSFINYVIKNDNQYHYFIDQRSDKFKEYYKFYNLEKKINTVYLIENNSIYSESEAIGRILNKCKSTGKILSFIILFFPKFISNRIYRVISENRFYLFKNQCIIPNKEINSRTIK